MRSPSKGLFRSRNNLRPSHIREQYRGHSYAAIRLLVIFQHSNEDARQGQTRTIEGMNKLRFGPGPGPIADTSPASLEVGAIAATADLQPLLATSGPHFNIVGLGGGKAKLGSA